MTTGCRCATPGCQGLTPQRGGTCMHCQIEATPEGVARTIRSALYGVLYGRDIQAVERFGPCDRSTEAGS
jgi:hypothetical protein